MKKTLFMLAAASLAMTACTNTEEVEQGFAQTSKQIGFVSHVNKNTRALVNDNFNKFSVFGSYTTEQNAKPVQVFNGIVVTKETDKVWNYTDAARYWIDGAKYKFYAYSKENGVTTNVRLDAETGKFSLVNYIVNNENQKDLVFASAIATGKNEQNEKVAFDFKHILSKIQFNFISDFPKGYTLVVDQVELKNMRDKGTFELSGDEFQWKDVNRTTGDMEVDEDNMTQINIPFKTANTSGTLGDSGKEDETLVLAETTSDIYVLPYEYAKSNVRIYFQVTIKNANGEQVSQKRNYGAFKPTWEKGTAYKYNVTLTGAAAGLEKIEFTTAENMNLNDWISGTDTDLNFGSDI